MNAFFEFWINFLSLFERNPPLATAYSCLFLFSFLVIAWTWKKHFSKDHILHEQAKLLHTSLKDSAILADEFHDLKAKALHSQKQIQILQQENAELIESLEILNKKFIESENMRQILIEENHEIRMILTILYEILVPDQMKELNKHYPAYKKYLD